MTRWTRRLFALGMAVPALVAFGSTACGARTILPEELEAQSGGRGGGGGVNPCGDGACSALESCSTCPLDCGFCASCPNGSCDAGETCNSCAQDCGICKGTCGDGFCKDGENCLSCAPDCGACPGCGDNKCDATIETCFSCPRDCGACKSCGDGKCTEETETCASCGTDCGVCSVCGNKKCEPFESCTNCQEDCGKCETTGCFQVLQCVLKCIDPNQKPPAFSITCVADCVSLGCADVKFFVDQAVTCAIGSFASGKCEDQACILKECDSKLGACFSATCPQP